eukprot:11222920-Lingulodinium_polyedra.AAC.1
MAVGLRFAIPAGLRLAELYACFVLRHARGGGSWFRFAVQEHWRRVAFWSLCVFPMPLGGDLRS